MIGINKSGNSNTQDIAMFKSDQSKTIDANLMKKHFGDKNIGQILNDVADPNNSQNKKVRNVNNKMGKDAFMKLLLTQLKNQDPMSPLESHDMAAQLAQFSSLEKLDGISTGIGKLSQSTTKNTSYDSLNLIGKIISGDSSKILRDVSGESHEINFSVDKPVKTVKIEVINQVGETVFSEELGNIDKGKHSVNWNGIGPTGVDAPVGDYAVVVAAVNSDGKTVPVNTQFTGQVTGVNFSAKGPILLVGKRQIPLNEVKKIELPKANRQEVQAAPVQKSSQNILNEKVRAQMVPEAGKNNVHPLKQLSTKMSLVNGGLSKANMSAEMINKISESIKK